MIEKASGVKNTLDCMAELTLALVYVAAAGLLVVKKVIGVSKRGPAIKQEPHQIQN